MFDKLKGEDRFTRTARCSVASGGLTLRKSSDMDSMCKLQKKMDVESASKKVERESER